ncbi:Hypothetical predicted protein [Olea europaea subsp. europaea]|uniref:Uncharacterized protein n=1 Tax=Olea europaea subsp. europaea TaxID=158383 RepID=A0A8S0TP49_OLEEU|nr:Hypothetical predicted protein [Olea europaea subsp. europaea]
MEGGLKKYFMKKMVAVASLVTIAMALLNGSHAFGLPPCCEYEYGYDPKCCHHALATAARLAKP